MTERRDDATRKVTVRRTLTLRQGRLGLLWHAHLHDGGSGGQVIASRHGFSRSTVKRWGEKADRKRGGTALTVLEVDPLGCPISMELPAIEFHKDPSYLPKESA